MTIDNQLILGIVFITAGIAMALLAYAAFLNRQDASDEDDDGQAEPAAATDAGEPAELAPPVVEEGPVMATVEMATVEPDMPAAKAPAPAPTAHPTEVPVPAVPSTAGGASAEAVLRRDGSTGRLAVQVGERIYNSYEALRESADWPEVDSLFSDALAWLLRSSRTSEESPKQEVRVRGQGGSMVDQINEILSEKTGEGSSVPAVRLTESAGGSIRVYIGINSYPMDEVPDEGVRQLIQRAVSEWESRQ